MDYQNIFKKPYNLDLIHDYIEHLSLKDKIRYRILEYNCNDSEEYVELVILTLHAKNLGMTLDEYLLSYNDKYYAQEQSEKQAAAVKEEQEALRLASLFSQYQSQHQPQIKIVEKPVKVIKEVPVEVIKEVPVEIIKEIPIVDPKQQAKIAELEKQLNTMQNQQSSVIIEPEDTRPVEPIHLINISEDKKKEYRKLIKQRKKTMAEIAAENGWNESDLRASL